MFLGSQKSWRGVVWGVSQFMAYMGHIYAIIMGMVVGPSTMDRVYNSIESVLIIVQTHPTGYS